MLSPTAQEEIRRMLSKEEQAKKNASFWGAVVVFVGLIIMLLQAIYILKIF